jgi:electron transfer flavoprotein alpha subunit
MLQYKGVWVLTERRDDEFKDGALELLGEGRRIADKMNESLIAVIPGNISEEGAKLLSQHGAKRILSVEYPMPVQDSLEVTSQVLSAMIKTHAPEVVLYVHTTNGADLACRVAANLGAGLITACDRIDVNDENLLVAVKLIHGGKASASYVCPHSKPQMATVNLDALELKRPDPGASAEVISVQIDVNPEIIKTKIVDFLPGDPRAIDLTEAEIVVAGGRGFGSASNFELIQDLADLLRGSVGASRWAVDEKWLPPDRQIGLTGKTVSPKLYIGCGISGASQHTMGMKGSKVIVAVNKDKNAPIFEIADLCVVGDVLKVIPSLIEQLREEEQQNTDAIMAATRGSANGEIE